MHGEWCYFYRGKKKVDVVPLGTDRLLDLIPRFIMCKGGVIMGELSQGQNTAFL